MIPSHLTLSPKKKKCVTANAYSSRYYTKRQETAMHDSVPPVTLLFSNTGKAETFHLFWS